MELRFLPPYSPNLNPIERLWKFMNEKVLWNKYYEKFSAFKHAVMGFLESLSSPSPEILHQLKKRITNRFHLYSSV